MHQPYHGRKSSISTVSSRNSGHNRACPADARYCTQPCTMMHQLEQHKHMHHARAFKHKHGAHMAVPSAVQLPAQRLHAAKTTPRAAKPITPSLCALLHAVSSTQGCRLGMHKPHDVAAVHKQMSAVCTDSKCTLQIKRNILFSHGRR